MTIRTAGIVPLNADEVFTVRPPRADQNKLDGVEYAKLVAKGMYNHSLPEWFNLGMVPFDFGHLQNPIPASVYYDAKSAVCWGKLAGKNCATITDSEYRPALAFKDTVWSSIVGEWYDCDRPGLVDPPIALVPIYTTLDKPRLSTHAPPRPGDIWPQYQSLIAPSGVQADPTRGKGARQPTETVRDENRQNLPNHELVNGPSGSLQSGSHQPGSVLFSSSQSAERVLNEFIVVLAIGSIIVAILL
jgi:hypothetical protein